MEIQDITKSIIELTVIVEYIYVLAERCLPDLMKVLEEYNTKDNLYKLLHIITEIIAEKTNELDKEDIQYIDDIIYYHKN